MTDEAPGTEIRVLSERCIERITADGAEAQVRAAALRRTGAWREVVAGERSVTVLFDPLSETARDASVRLAAAWAEAPPPLEGATLPPVTLTVRYGGAAGPDLDRLALATGLMPDEVRARHAARLYTVAMLGFTPGFAYLEGLDPTLRVPRLAVPRARVPAGSVAVSGARTGLYALDGPGGWCLIGRTEDRLFDPEGHPPARLLPGQRVRFVAA